jgi:hypothetical protein
MSIILLISFLHNLTPFQRARSGIVPVNGTLEKICPRPVTGVTDGYTYVGLRSRIRGFYAVLIIICRKGQDCVWGPLRRRRTGKCQYLVGWRSQILVYNCQQGQTSIRRANATVRICQKKISSFFQNPFIENFLTSAKNARNSFVIKTCF